MTPTYVLIGAFAVVTLVAVVRAATSSDRWDWITPAFGAVLPAVIAVNVFG